MKRIGSARAYIFEVSVVHRGPKSQVSVTVSSVQGKRHEQLLLGERLITRDMTMGLKTLILGVDTKEVAQLD